MAAWRSSMPLCKALQAVCSAPRAVRASLSSPSTCNTLSQVHACCWAVGCHCLSGQRLLGCHARSQMTTKKIICWEAWATPVLFPVSVARLVLATGSTSRLASGYRAGWLCWGQLLWTEFGCVIRTLKQAQAARGKHCISSIQGQKRATCEHAC